MLQIRVFVPETESKAYNQPLIEVYWERMKFDKSLENETRISIMIHANLIAYYNKYGKVVVEKWIMNFFSQK